MADMTTSLHVAVKSKKAKDGLNAVSVSSDKTKKSVKGLSGSVDKLDKRMVGLGKTSSKVKGMVAGMIAGFSGYMVVRSMTKTIAEYGQTMSTLKAVTQGSTAAMAALEAQSRQLGATTKYSATQAGEGQVFLARAGFDANQILAAMPSTLDLATAGALGLAEAADTASNILSQFNMRAEETVRVADVLVNTSNSANTNVMQMAEAFKMAGPVAGALGHDIESTAAAIGVLGDSGIQASLAGTNLRGVLAGLLGPTSAAQRAIKGMDIALADVDPSANSLIDIFDEFSDRSLSAADAVEIFGRRNAAAALIMAANVEKMRKLTQANREAEDAAKNAAAIMKDNLAGALKSLKSTIEEAYLATGDAGFTGGLRSMVETSTEAIRILIGLKGAEEDASTSAKALAVSIKLVTTSLAAMALVSIEYQLLGITSATTGLGKALKKVGTIFVTNPLFATTAIITGAMVAMYAFADSASAAEKRVKGLNDATSDLAVTIERFELAQAKNIRGIELGSLELRAAAYEDMAKSLESASYQLRTSEEKFVSLSQLKTLKVDTSYLEMQYTEALKKSFDEAIATADWKQLSAAFSAGLDKGLFDVPQEFLDDLEDFQEVLTSIDKGDPQGAIAKVLAIEGEKSSKYYYQYLHGMVERFFDAAKLTRVPMDEAIKTIEIEIQQFNNSAKALEDKVEAGARTTLEGIESDLAALDKKVEMTEGYEKARTALNEYLDGLKQQTSLLRMDRENREYALAALEAENQLKSAGADVMLDSIGMKDKMIDQIAKEILFQDRLNQLIKDGEKADEDAQAEIERKKQAIAELIEMMERERASLRGLKEDMEFDLKIANLGELDKRRAVFLENIARSAKVAGLNVNDTVASFRRLYDEAENASRMKGIFDSMGSAAGQMATDMWVHTNSVADAFESMMRRIQALLFDEFVSKQIASYFSGMLGSWYGLGSKGPPPIGGGSSYASGGGDYYSKGGVFDYGMPIPHAKGAVINEYSLFRSGGKIHSMAENEPEGIFPIRWKNGELGVVNAGEDKDGARKPTVIKVTQNFYVKDHESFRKNRRQMRGDAQGMMENYA